MSKPVLLLAALCALVAPCVASGAVVNGGFETGDLTGWTVAGSAGAPTAAIGVTPTVGTFQGFIETTGNFTAEAPVVLASLDVSAATVDALGITPYTRGTGISQDVTVAADGDALTFDWNFLTDELDEDPVYNDFAFFVVDGAAFLLASRNSSSFDTGSPPPGFDGLTGWFNYSHTFATAGTHKIGFGVFNVTDTGHNSVLLLDDITLPVPEPSTIALVLAALPAALVLWRRKRG